MNLSALLRSFSRHRRNRKQSPVAASYSCVGEALEERALLTLAVNFDYQMIASDLSPDLRLFGSSNPDDAPFEVIRYGMGTLTSLEGFDGGTLLARPEDLTFEVGSQDTTNPLSVMTLDRDAFDDGTTDGIANQNYVPSTHSFIRFSYAGVHFANARLEELSLSVTPDGLTTGTGRIGILLQANQASDQKYRELRSLMNDTFSEDANHDPANARRFTLTPFQHTGPWAGIGDAEIFASAGRIVSGDDIPDQRSFATPWDPTTPLTGTATHGVDNEFVSLTLDPQNAYTFRSTNAGDAQVIDFYSTYSGLSTPSNFHSRLLNDNSTTVVTMTPRSAETQIGFGQMGGTWQLELIDSQPASLNLYFLDDLTIGWTPELDAQSNPLPADGYRIELSNSQGVFHQTDVNGQTLTYSLDGLLGMDDQQVRVGRITGGQVTTWTEYRHLQEVRVRAEFTGFDGRRIQWKAIPGVTTYELVLNDINTRIVTSNTFYDLPDDYPVGWRRAWVRGMNGRFSGDWSPTLHYHFRTQMHTPQVSTNNPARPDISWAALAGAAQNEVYLQNASTLQVVQQSGVTGTSWTPDSDLSSGRWRVWVRARSDANIPTAWSQGISFLVAPEPLAITGTAADATFSWNLPPDIVSTDLYIINAGQVIQHNGLTGTSHTETQQLNQGNVAWWVRGTSSTGSSTAWQRGPTVRVGSSQITEYPDSLPPIGTSTFRWAQVLGAQSYELLLRHHGAGDSVVDAGTALTADVRLEGGRYTVWVNTLFADGTNHYSRPVTFDVLTGARRYITTNSGLAANPPTITWVPTGDHLGTRLWVRSDDDGTDRHYFTTADTTSFTLPDPLPAGRYRIWAGRSITPVWSSPIVLILGSVTQSQDQKTDGESRPDSELQLAALDVSALNTIFSKAEDGQQDLPYSGEPHPPQAATDNNAESDTRMTRRPLTQPPGASHHNPGVPVVTPVARAIYTTRADVTARVAKVSAESENDAH